MGKPGSGVPRLRPGDVIETRVLKADGHLYRSWHSRIESIDERGVVACTRRGERVKGPGGGWPSKHHWRHVYWFDRPYNLTELYEPDGRLKQVYIDIASPPALAGQTLVYTDHELDVVVRGQKAPYVVDQDEFEEAAVRYGYSERFQEACWQAVDEALKLAATWSTGGSPHDAL